LHDLALTRQQHAVLLQVRRQAHRFLRGRGRDHGLGAVRESGDHGGGGPQHVDDDDAPASEISCVQAERREVDGDVHAGFLRSCGSRSRNIVSTVPAMKSGWRRTRPRKGIVVVTPSMINESSACRIRARASGRVLPCTRTAGPPGGWYAVMVPGDGWKLRAGSSALTRHSMAWPRRRWPFITNDNGSPAATRICSFTRSKFVHISVTGCSTWMRVFISM